MTDLINEAGFRVNGRYGEAWLIRRGQTPLKLFEATQIRFSRERAQQDVQLAGNRDGTKDGAWGAVQGQMNLTLIDSTMANIVLEGSYDTLQDRRAARNRGERRATTFDLEVWLDDDEALGAFGWVVKGVRLSRVEGGFDFGQTLTLEEHPFRAETFRQIAAFERIGNTIGDDGLPSVRYTTDLAGIANYASGVTG